MISTEERLKAFQEENNIYTKGPLSLVVQFTRLVQNKDFPLNPDDFQKNIKRAWHYTTIIRRRRAHQSRKYGVNDKVR